MSSYYYVCVLILLYVCSGMETPAVGSIPMTPEMMNEIRFQKDVDERNRPWVEEELDALFPTEGYEVLQPPASYKVLTYADVC